MRKTVGMLGMMNGVSDCECNLEVLYAWKNNYVCVCVSLGIVWN